MCCWIATLLCSGHHTQRSWPLLPLLSLSTPSSCSSGSPGEANRHQAERGPKAGLGRGVPLPGPQQTHGGAAGPFPSSPEPGGWERLAQSSPGGKQPPRLGQALCFYCQSGFSGLGLIWLKSHKTGPRKGGTGTCPHPGLKSSLTTADIFLLKRSLSRPSPPPAKPGLSPWVLPL